MNGTGIDLRGRLQSPQALRPLMGPLYTPDLVKAFQRSMAALLESEPT
jgi:hypothetical protein